jgi:hypothetical protein
MQGIMIDRDFVKLTRRDIPPLLARHISSDDSGQSPFGSEPIGGACQQR